MSNGCQFKCRMAKCNYILFLNKCMLCVQCTLPHEYRKTEKHMLKNYPRQIYYSKNKWCNKSKPTRQRANNNKKIPAKALSVVIFTALNTKCEWKKNNEMSKTKNESLFDTFKDEKKGLHIRNCVQCSINTMYGLMVMAINTENTFKTHCTQMKPTAQHYCQSHPTANRQND